MEAQYDVEKISKTFEESAALAEWLYRTHVKEGMRDTNAAMKHDELLARMAVYSHLKAGAFLESKEQLLAELRWLLKHDRPMTPRNALDPAMFARGRSKLLQSLISRFEPQEDQAA